MERRDRAACVYFCVALAASVGLALAIAYLEVRRSQEIVQLELRWVRELHRLQREVEALSKELDNRTAALDTRIDKMGEERAEDGVPPGEDDYYYDEYVDEEETEGEGGKRTKREVGGRINPALAPYNLILRQGYKTYPNRTGPLEVKAKIIVHQENEGNQPLPYNVHESTDRPQHHGAAIHFQGDTTTVRHSGRSHCYDVNHRMCHIEGIFRDWKPTSWGDHGAFSMSHGHLTIKRSPGIYYLYSQIFYADNHDTNGYRVYVNGEPKFQCTVTGLHDHRWIPSRVPYKKNSCYTGGLIQLREGDSISIREIDNSERYSVFEPYKSYFGLFRVVPMGGQGRRR